MTNEPKIEDIKMLIHLSLATVHMRKDVGTLVWEGHPENGKKVYIEVSTPKHKNGDFGKAKVIYYLEGKGTPIFKDPKKFFDHYKPKNQ